MVSDNAYSILTVEKFDEERRTFGGVATTPTPDRDGDIVEPLGVDFQNPLILLLHHDKERSVGHVTFQAPTPKGIAFEGTIIKTDEPGRLKSDSDDAWQRVKHKLFGVSVRVRGRISDVKKLATGGLHWLKSEVTELSLVTIPSNKEATIHFVKSLDIDRPAASGLEALESAPNTPRSRGPSGAVYLTRKDTSMKTYTEQIKDFENTRAAKVAERDAIQEKASNEGRTKDETEREKFKELSDNIQQIDSELVDLRSLEQSNKAAAVPVNGDTPQKAATARSGDDVIVRVKDRGDPSMRYARYAMCIALCKGNYMAAEQIARSRYPDDSQMHEVLKAAVAAGTTTDANWAGNLVQYQNLLEPFIELLRARTILGQFGQNGIPPLNQVPFKVRVFSETTEPSAYWVEEGKPKPVSKGAFGTLTLDFHKLATIAVLTQEEVRFSSPSAEARVRNLMVNAIAKRADLDFIDPANAGVSNTKPASITNGVVATTPTGTTAAHFRTDMSLLLGSYQTNNYDPTGIVLIMSGSSALALSLMRNTLGNREFPDLTVRGGTLEGFPVIVSQHLASLGSPSTGMIVAVSTKDIFLADDGQAVIDASDQASLEMDDAPSQDGAAGTGASLVSLWQNNLLGLKAERFITWKKARATAVQYLSPVAYAA
jgi:HK97 family phage major capsid protein